TSTPASSPKRTVSKPKTTAPATTSPNSTSTDAATNRAATTTPKSAPPTPAVSAPSTPVQSAGGCGAGKIATPLSGTVTGTFGEPRTAHTHAGQDIAAPTGTAVRAAQCGTVTTAGADGS